MRGKRKMIIIGLAGRLTSYLGKNQYCVTAPGTCTSGSSLLGSFQGTIEANINTILIKTAQVNCVSLAFDVKV